MNGSVQFDGTTSSIPTTLSNANLKIVCTSDMNVNVWASYSSVWSINVSDSSFVGTVYYIVNS